MTTETLIPPSKEMRRSNVINVLNKARSMELHAIHQYMNQHYNLDNLDYGDLAAKVKLIAIDEMRHAEMFAERIEELKDQPTCELISPVIKGQSVDDIYPHDMDLETNTIEEYNRFLQICRDNNDNVSANLFEKIVDEEQIHLNYFENVDDHLKELRDSFLAKIAGTPSESDTPHGFVDKYGGTE